MKLITFLLCTFFLFGCEKNEISGIWLFKIELQNKNLPIVVEIKNNENKLKATLYNGDEKLHLDGMIKNSKFELNLTESYAKFVGEIKSNKLEGHWIRTNKEDYKIPFSALRYGQKDYYAEFKKQKSIYNFSGNWKVKLKEDRFALGAFKQEGNFIKGSFITETGDYRFMHGYILKDQAKLFGFDGAFSFIFNFKLASDKFKGQMLAGKSTNREISATRDNDFKLADPYKMTKALHKDPISFSAQSIEGRNIDIQKMKDKAKVIQIFGSWCPNCIDETKYFIKWRGENKDKLDKIEFIAVAFENASSEKQALKNLKKLSHKMKIDYPVVLVDFNHSKKVTDFFPIDKTRAFPTTIYLDKNNIIKKIHTGFSGQATGEFFTDFTKEFNQTINSLL